jgi:hypothetical protein
MARAFEKRFVGQVGQGGCRGCFRTGKAAGLVFSERRIGPIGPIRLIGPTIEMHANALGERKVPPAG